MFRRVYKSANDDIVPNEELLERILAESKKPQKKHRTYYGHGSMAACLAIAIGTLAIYPSLKQDIDKSGSSVSDVVVSSTLTEDNDAEFRNFPQSVEPEESDKSDSVDVSYEETEESSSAKNESRQIVTPQSEKRKSTQAVTTPSEKKKSSQAVTTPSAKKESSQTTTTPSAKKDSKQPTKTQSAGVVSGATAKEQTLKEEPKQETTQVVKSNAVQQEENIQHKEKAATSSVVGLNPSSPSPTSQSVVNEEIKTSQKPKVQEKATSQNESESVTAPAAANIRSTDAEPTYSEEADNSEQYKVTKRPSSGGSGGGGGSSAAGGNVTAKISEAEAKQIANNIFAADFSQEFINSSDILADYSGYYTITRYTESASYSIIVYDNGATKKLY